MTTIPFAVREARQVSDLAGQPAKPGGTESQGFFGRVANLPRGGPPAKRSPAAAGTANRATKANAWSALHGTVRQYAQALGGEVVGRNSILCPGPGHSARDRSLSVSFLGDGAFLVHSHASDGWQACRDHVSARLNLQEEWKRPSTVNVALDTDAAGRALELWRETKPLKGSPGEAYLERRGVRYDGEALRWHPSCPFGRDRVGCMVGLVRNIKTNEPQGIHRTALTPAGEKLSGLGSNGRLSLGPTRGGAIKLTDDADVERVIALGEGIETTLSIRRLPGLELMPVWAVLSANGIASFPELNGIESVWIAADRDASGTGQRASQALAQRLDAAGIEPIIIIPQTVGSDLNDKAVANV